MTTDNERLVVLVEARITEFERRMKKAEQTGSGSYRRLRSESRGATRQMEADMNKSARSIDNALMSATRGIGSFGKTFVAGLAGGAVTAVLAGATGSVAQLASGIAAVGDEAKRAGLSASEFQQWRYVAEQNRIGIDSLVDGFKELSLRADEFIVTGAGPAAEAFARLGYSAADLQVKLKDPSALMLEIIGRLDQLDKAAQIRIADELFGGTGGERFVELIAQGEAGIARTKDRAVELGTVMTDDLIAKASELDRLFSAVSSTVGVGLKSAIVAAAFALADFIDGFRAFESQRDTTLQGRVDDIMRERAGLVEELKGMQSGSTLTDTAKSLGFKADDLISQQEIDRVQQRIDDLTEQEEEIIGVMSDRTTERYVPKDPEWTPPPPPPPGGLPKDTTGSGGRGASSSRNEFDDALARIREQTAARQMEAETLQRLAGANTEVADAAEFARIKTELLTAAQRAGTAITPDLEAQIDSLAMSYVTAGQSAEASAESMRLVEENSERGANALSGIFDSVVSGSMSAKEAIASLLMEMARVQAQKAFLGLSKGNGFMATIGGLLGLADGGQVRGPGTGRSDSVLARLSNGEFVVNAAATARNLPLLEAINGQIAGYKDGGLFGSLQSSPGGGCVGAPASKFEARLCQ